MSLKEKIRAEALRLGFSKAGFTKPELSFPQEKLLSWLRKGMHADMEYMERNLELRLDPKKLFPGVKTVICLATNYYPGPVPTKGIKISRYALGKDYHRVLKKMMKKLFAFIKKLRPEAEARFFVDSAPVLERVLAQQAGLGWIGKNTMLITREFGSWVFLSEIFINIEMEPDPPFEHNFCGTCDRCIKACPTQALRPYELDSRKCLSYITIESKGPVPEWYYEKSRGWIFGCDICQEVCPWNRKAPITRIKEFMPLSAIASLTPEKIKGLSEEELEELTRGTALKRAGARLKMLVGSKGAR